MSNPKDLIAHRPGVEGDRAFIIATFTNGLYFGDKWYKRILKGIFLKNYSRVVDALLDKPEMQVKIACLREDPDVILGYSLIRQVGEDVALDWVFVKQAWRKIGIGKSLVPDNVTVVTHLTPVGESLMKKAYPKAIFNPFIL